MTTAINYTYNYQSGVDPEPDSNYTYDGDIDVENITAASSIGSLIDAAICHRNSRPESFKP